MDTKRRETKWSTPAQRWEQYSLTLEQVLATEMQPYHELAPEVRKRVQSRYADLDDSLKPFFEAYTASEEEYQAALRTEDSQRKVKRVAEWILYTFLSLVAGLAVLDVIGVTDLAFSRVAIGTSAPAVTALATLAFGIWRLFADARTPMAQLKIRLNQADSDLREQIRVAVGQLATQELNELVGPTDVESFRSRGPSLVELDSSQVIPSQSQQDVEAFILHHEASAIGLAGPRGIGKTTILRSITGSDIAASTLERTLGVYIAAPVKYEPLALLRHVFEEIVMAGLGPRVGTDRRLRGLTLWIRLGVGFLIINAGIGLMVAGEGVWRSVEELQGWQYLGLILLLTGLVLWALDFIRYRQTTTGRLAQWRSRDQSEDPKAIRALEEGLALLRWEVEFANATSVSFKATGYIETADEASKTERERERTRPELAAALRRVMRDYADCSRRHERIVICIDELDKLADPADAVNVVNELKDLMHVRGVHFVISVSTDALNSFALRGVPLRDAFDSTFDEIVGVARLTVAESVEILSTRAVGFPRPLSMFCHAWSGGLPRDLLRTARSSVLAAQRSTEEAPILLGGIARSVIERDVARATRAYLVTSGLLGRMSTEGVKTVEGLLESVGSPEGIDELRELTGGLHRESGLATGDWMALANYYQVARASLETYGPDYPYGVWRKAVQDGSLAAVSERLATEMAAVGYVSSRLA